MGQLCIITTASQVLAFTGISQIVGPSILQLSLGVLVGAAFTQLLIILRVISKNKTHLILEFEHQTLRAYLAWSSTQWQLSE